MVRAERLCATIAWKFFLFSTSFSYQELDNNDSKGMKGFEQIVSCNFPQIEASFGTAADRHKRTGYGAPVRAGDSPIIE